MESGLHHMSQAPTGSDPSKLRMDPALQAQATALRLLAARADQLRDRIGSLLQTIQQDPVGDRTRQSMLPWPTLLEWYQDIFRQVLDFSSFLRNPHLSNPSGLPQPNLLQTHYVLPQREFGAGPDAIRLYNEGDPALRFAPELNYAAKRIALFSYYAQEMEIMQKDPMSLGFVSDEELHRLLHETERADRLPGIYRAACEAVDIVGDRLGKAQGVVKNLEGNFDWKLRLGDIYGSDGESDEDDEEDDDGSGDEDEEEAEEEVQVVTAPSISTSTSMPNSASTTTATTASASTSHLSAAPPLQPKLEDPEISIISQPPLQAYNPKQGTTSSAPIDLDLSSDDDDEDDDMESVPVPVSNPIPATITSQGASPSAHSSPLFGTEDGSGTAQNSPAEMGLPGQGKEADDEDEDMDEVAA